MSFNIGTAVTQSSSEYESARVEEQLVQDLPPIPEEPEQEVDVRKSVTNYSFLNRQRPNTILEVHSYAS